MKRFAVTGAHGFVGRALCAALVSRGFPVTGIVRRPEPLASGVLPWVFEGQDFAGIAEAWRLAGPACDCVIHLAARVHMMQESAADPLAEYRAANVDGVLRVAEVAVQAGVRRFVFVSSVKALGDADRGVPWREDDLPLELDPYGSSKREAEQALLDFGRSSGLEVVIVRPPLVYGPGVRANFLRLLSVVGKRLPPTPWTNGSGNDPTTAGIESVAVQSWRSHQIRSPRWTAVVAAPCGAWTPLT